MGEENEGRSIGVDLHPNRFNTAEIGLESGRVQRERYEVPDGLESFVSRLRKEDVVVVEATTNTFAFAALFKDKVKRVIVVHPGENQDIIRSNKKTDRIDAMRLARLGIDITRSGRLIKQATIPEEAIIRLRSLFTTYELVSKEITMTRCRIHSLLVAELHPYVGADIMDVAIRERIESDETLSSGTRLQIKMMYAALDLFYSQILELKDEIVKFARLWPGEMRILISMDGVSILVALALKSDYGDIQRFKNGKHLCSYMRVAPTVEASNGKIKYGPVNKQSRHLGLRFLLQTIQHYYGSNEYAREWREEKIKHKSRGKVRIALARKMLMCLYSMLKHGELYRTRSLVTFARKEKELEAIIELAA